MAQCETLAETLKKARKAGFGRAELKALQTLLQTPNDKLFGKDYLNDKVEYSMPNPDEQVSNVNTLWAKLNGVVALRFRGNPESTYQTIKQILVDDNTLETKIITDKGSYTFAQGQNRSKDFNSNNFVVVDGLANITNDYIRKSDSDTLSYEEAVAKTQPLVDKLRNRIEGLQSSNKETSFTDAIEVKGHGNIGMMQELVSRLNELAGNPADGKHVSYLQGLIGSMKPEFFTKMQTYLNDNATDTVGIVRDGKINININKNGKLAANTQSGAEVYAHEIVHAYTMFALRDGGREASAIRRQLRHLRGAMGDELSWKVFMPSEVDSVDKATEETNAHEMWDYIFDNKNTNSVDEFVAHVLTNPKLMKQAKKMVVHKAKTPKTIFDVLTETLGKIMDMLSGKFNFGKNDKSVLQEVTKLTHELGEINNKATVKLNENESALNRMMGWFNGLEGDVSEKLKNGLGKLEKKWPYTPMPRNGSKLEYATWLVKFLPRLALDPKMRPHFEHVVKMLGLGTNGLVQNVLREFRTPDELNLAINKLQMQSNRIDQLRENLATTTKETLNQGFKTKLTEDQDVALSRAVLDTDLQSIYDSYSEKTMQKLLRDPKELATEINRVRQKLKDVNEKYYNWNATQAMGLGYYMATGNISEVQALNAESIANGSTRKEPKEVVKGEVELIDKLATLGALSFTNELSKKTVADLIENEGVGVQNMVNMHKDFVKQSRDKLFSGVATAQIKGYTKEIFNDSIALEVAPEADRVDMEKRGYEYMHSLEPDEDLGISGMAMYRSKSFNRQEYYKTATKLTNISKKGTSLKDIALSRGGTEAKNIARINKAKLDLKRVKMMREIDKGTFDVTKVKHGKGVLLNDEGRVVDYRYMMDKGSKENMLEQDKAATHVLGRSVASVYDKTATAEHNKKVLEYIWADMAENYTEDETIGHNGYEYIRIEPNSTNKKVQDLWKMLPAGMKRDILNTEMGHIAVREDMLFNYFGFRHFSMANNMLTKHLPNIVRTALKIIEEIWQGIVSGAKIDMLIKFPQVVLGNILSNAIFSVTTGTNPVELARLYVEEGRNIREYMTKHKKLAMLEASERAGNVLGNDLSKINRLKSDLEANPIHELFEQGIYESIMEDLNEADRKANSTIGKFIKKKTENVPEGLKTAWHWLNLDEETLWYQNMEMMLRMGDLLGQAVENRKRKLINENKLGKIKAQLKKDGINSDKIGRLIVKERTALDKARLEGISEDFIFYGAPSSIFEEYANRIGLVMFTKYLKRIQRITKKTVLNHPLRSLGVILADDYLFNDTPDTIFDHTLADKTIDGKLGGMFPGFENILRYNTPAMLRAVNVI